MEFNHWLSLFGICLLGAMSPGPSLAVVSQSTLRGGFTSGAAAALAHGLGVGLYGLLTITGLAVVIANSPALFLAIQLAGAAYLLYLGVKSVRGSKAPDSAEDTPTTGIDRPLSSGFLIAFLNPKLALFMLALFSQFINADAGPLEKTIMVLTVGLTDALWYCAVAALLSRPRTLLALRSNAGTIDRLFGLVLIVLAVTVLARALGVF